MTIWTYNLPSPKVHRGVIAVEVDGEPYRTWPIGQMVDMVKTLEKEFGESSLQESPSIVLYWNEHDLNWLQERATPQATIH